MSADFQQPDAGYSSNPQGYMPPVVPPTVPYTSPQPQMQPQPYVAPVQPVPQPYVVQPQVYPDPNAQQYAQPADYPKPGEAVPAVQDVNIDFMMRRGFIIKTYGILIAQLAFTFGLVCLSLFDTVRKFFIWGINPETHYILLLASIVIIIVVAIMLSCSRTLARTVPVNYILLSLFTVSMTYYLMLICAWYTPESVLFALALTIAATVGLTVYAWKTKTDFTYCGFFLFSFCFILFFTGLFCLCFMSYYMLLVYEALGVCLFSLYLIYDTQLVVGQMGQKFSIDDYVLAALNLYIDIIQLFLKLLSIFGKAR